MNKALILALLLFSTTAVEAAESSDASLDNTTTTETISKQEQIHGKVSFDTEKVPHQVKVIAKTKDKTYVAYANRNNGFHYHINIPKGEDYTLALDETLNEKYKVTRTGTNFSLSLIPTEKLTYTIHIDDQGTALIPKNLRMTLFDDGKKLPLLPHVNSDFKTGTYTYTFTVLKDGSHYTAQPAMDNEKQYTLTRTNTTTFDYKAKVTTLKGRVQFIDSTTDVRPSQVFVNIMNQQQVASITKASASQQWQFQSKALVQCDENGVPYTYHLKGENIPFYQAPVVDNNVITYRAKWWQVPVEKVDQTTKQPLQGGVIQIVDQATGKVILPVHGTLPVDKTYEAVTLIAPYGYKKASPVVFRLLKDGTLQVKNSQGFVDAKNVTIPYEKAATLPLKQGGGGSLPPFEFPKIDLPTGNLPSLDLPKMDTSKLNLPKLDLSQKPASNFELPQLDLPKLDLPKMDLSNMDQANSKLPQFNLASPEAKDTSDSTSSSGDTTQPSSDDTYDNEVKSNGGLGNFADLFKNDKAGDLPQTGNHQSVVLPVIGVILIIIAGGIAYLIWRKK